MADKEEKAAKLFGSKSGARILDFLPAYLFALLIWIMASVTGDDLDRIQKYPDNLWLRFFLSDPFMHLMVFGLLTLFLCRGYDQDSKSSIPMARVGFLASVYGALIELYQATFPGGASAWTISPGIR